MSHETAPIFFSLPVSPLGTGSQAKPSPRGGWGKAALRWLASLRRALALLVYPELRDVEDQARARGESIAAYRSWLIECERQRLIDEDARHALVAVAAGYRGKYHTLLGDLKEHVRRHPILSQVLEREAGNKRDKP